MLCDAEVLTIQVPDDPDGLYICSDEESVTTLAVRQCERQSNLLAGFILGVDCRARLPAPAIIPSREHYQRYRALVALARETCREHGRHCPVLLEPQLRGLEGRRVDVTDCRGDTRRFVVGRSSGFMPVHLELESYRSPDGPQASGAPYRRVRPLTYGTPGRRKGG